MAKIYLINVGANTAHASQARTPLFPDGRFQFVSFPDEGSAISYEPAAKRFVSDYALLKTHADPDWDNLTYGDNCRNQRAKALLSVQERDILLFWALFWQVTRTANIFEADDSERRWCLFGALTVAQVIKAEKSCDVAISESVTDRRRYRRAVKNAHVVDGKLSRITSRRHDVLFIGDVEHSALFGKAIDLEIFCDDGLLHRTVFSKGGQQLQWDKSPRWNSSLRSCRPVLDLSTKEDRARATQLRTAIRRLNPGFSLF